MLRDKTEAFILTLCFLSFRGSPMCLTESYLQTLNRFRCMTRVPDRSSKVSLLIVNPLYAVILYRPFLQVTYLSSFYSCLCMSYGLFVFQMCWADITGPSLLTVRRHQEKLSPALLVDAWLDKSVILTTLMHPPPASASSVFWPFQPLLSPFSSCLPSTHTLFQPCPLSLSDGRSSPLRSFIDKRE